MLKFSAALPKKSSVPLRPLIVLASAVALSLSAAPAALADTSISSNWSGYAAHRSGVHFRSVQAAWRQPRVSCSLPASTYSALWVGIGGFSQTSNALEQIGTEVDCSRTGRTVSSAWYELVPAPSVPISMTVRPGDLMSAKVTIGSSRHVTMTLTDATRHKTYTKTLRASSIDDTAAEWILEAPSVCFTDTSCQTLPLANFGSAGFGLATAKTSTGGSGSIASPLWDTTQITLAPGGRRFIGYTGGTAGGGATPSSLLAGGSAFTVAYNSFGLPLIQQSSIRRSSDGPAPYIRH